MMKPNDASRLPLSWIAGAFLLAGAPNAATAEERTRAKGDPSAAQPTYNAGEPSVQDTVQEALHYFRVHPEAIDSIRSSAHTRAFLPLIAAGYRYDDSKFLRFEEQTIFEPRQNNENTNTKANSASIGAVWDLRELVFNPAEVQVYGLIAIQRDIMLEVTRTYYLRRQLQLLKTKPAEDALAAATLDLRIDEFTATLDVLTGGWFSRASAGGAGARKR
jgi:hypothetical protein